MAIGPDDDLTAVAVNVEINLEGAAVLAFVLEGGRRLFVTTDRGQIERLGEQISAELSRVPPPAGQL